MKKIKVLIADNYRLNRDTFANVLNNDARFEVIAECDDADKAVDLVLERRPDVVLMNINLPVFSGMEATKKISSKFPFSRVIGVSVNAQPSYAKKMIAMGAKGYLTKNSSKDEMIKAMLEVNNGNKYLCDEIKNNLSNQLLSEEEKAPSVFSISKREHEIINLIKEGFTSKEIATMLNISFRTVEVHRHHILKKLKLKNTASLIRYVNMNL